LNKTTCGPEGRNVTSEFRDLWDYRDPQNSVRAEFELHRCSPHPYGVTIVGSAFWWIFGVGVSTAGVISDSRGRRFAWYLYLCILVAGSVGVAVAPDMTCFTIARLFCAFGIGGFSMIGFVWCRVSECGEPALHGVGAQWILYSRWLRAVHFDARDAKLAH